MENRMGEIYAMHIPIPEKIDDSRKLKDRDLVTGILTTPVSMFSFTKEQLDWMYNHGIYYIGMLVLLFNRIIDPEETILSDMKKYDEDMFMNAYCYAGWIDKFVVIPENLIQLLPIYNYNFGIIFGPRLKEVNASSKK